MLKTEEHQEKNKLQAQFQKYEYYLRKPELKDICAKKSHSYPCLLLKVHENSKHATLASTDKY